MANKEYDDLMEEFYGLLKEVSNSPVQKAINDLHFASGDDWVKLENARAILMRAHRIDPPHRLGYDDMARVTRKIKEMASIQDFLNNKVKQIQEPEDSE